MSFCKICIARFIVFAAAWSTVFLVEDGASWGIGWVASFAALVVAASVEAFIRSRAS